MIDIRIPSIYGWTEAIRGMRNPLNSWKNSDSDINEYGEGEIGPKDLKLMKSLGTAGSSHGKYKRMITVYVDITAPLYWWKEFDTYKVGTVANSCSTMHKIQEKAFGLSDFSHEHLNETSLDILSKVIELLNDYRSKFIEQKDKTYWWQMIQMLPSSYNQKRTVMLNYEVLTNIYNTRKGHKLDEWEKFREWIRSLPYSELITQEEKEEEEDTYE